MDSHCTSCKLNWTDEIIKLAGSPSAPVHPGAGTYLSICPKCKHLWVMRMGFKKDYPYATEKDISVEIAEWATNKKIHGR